jgi:hypothetical protein
MEQFVIDKIIDELRADPNLDPIAVVEANRVVATDMVEHVWTCAKTGYCEEGRTNEPSDYFRVHFNMDI